jgi:hypothetical protein
MNPETPNQALKLGLSRRIHHAERPATKLAI